MLIYISIILLQVVRFKIRFIKIVKIIGRLIKSLIDSKI